MTFEEFFTRKRIDLSALKNAEPVLFSEFETHFEQMGEKSFDHTKKYWFNKLRRLYHLPPEQKPEKVQIANPLSEQTITESLAETIESPKPTPELGFVPKFKATHMARPAVEDTPKPKDNPESGIEPADEPEEPKQAPRLGFTPKFRAANPPKPVEPDKKDEEEPLAETPSALPVIDDAPKPAYKPRFNMKNIPPKKEE